MANDKSMIEYKLMQLKTMQQHELNQEEEKRYGAYLSHWAGAAKPINLDEKALQALISHYEERLRE